MSEDNKNTENAFENYDLKAKAPEADKPNVRFAFEFPELLEKFKPADKAALSARRISRVFGFLAVGLVFGALLLATLGPYLTGKEADCSTCAAPVADASHAPPADAHAPSAEEHHEEGGHHDPLHLILGLVSATMGLIGTFLGLSGTRRTSARKKWLTERLKTETMRLFHFHYIAARLPEIVEIGADEARQKAYQTARSTAFAEADRRILADPQAEMTRIIERGEETTFPSIIPMMPVADDAPNPANAADIFAAWRKLRIDWQAGYCEAKLAHRRKGGVTPRRMEDYFAFVALACVVAIIVLHVAFFIGQVAGANVALLELVVIWIALIALAGRALEDGFAPQREVERYEQYRANVRVAAERFDGARTFAQKLDAMRAFERTSLEEMRVFMRTHAKARFLL